VSASAATLDVEPKEAPLPTFTLAEPDVVVPTDQALARAPGEAPKKKSTIRERVSTGLQRLRGTRVPVEHAPPQPPRVAMGRAAGRAFGGDPARTQAALRESARRNMMKSEVKQKLIDGKPNKLSRRASAPAGAKPGAKPTRRHSI
jgi:hypothetical protein